MDNTELSIKLNNTLNGTSLKAIQDKEGNDIADTYFPKSGGKLTGNIYFQNDLGTFQSAITHNFGSDLSSVKGQIEIVARGQKDNNNIYNAIRISPYGDILVGVNGIKNDLTSSAIVAKSISEYGYVKYASGLIVQWGRFKFSQGETIKDITPPIYCNYKFSFLTTQLAKRGEICSWLWTETQGKPYVEVYRLNGSSDDCWFSYVLIGI